ncbi:MAG: hypothetical protein WCP20_19955, partial [Desulfuromonadales bacterium]
MLSKIRVSHKLLLIYVLDLVTVAYLAYSMASEQLITIHFAKKEQVGNSYLTTVRQTLLDVYDISNSRTTRNRIDSTINTVKKNVVSLSVAEKTFGVGMDSSALNEKAVSTVLRPALIQGCFPSLFQAG